MKLNYKRTFLIGAAFLSITAFWQLYDNIIPLILTKTFNIGETARGVIMALDNILALFLLPFFGALSDKTSTKIGKRMPFILIGTLLATAIMIFLPIADNASNFWLFIILLGGVLLAMGSYRSPAVALMPDITPKPLRSKANAVINLMGALGGIYTLIMVKVFADPEAVKPNYVPVFASVAILMVVSVAVLFLTTNENKESAAAKKYEEEHPSALNAEEANVNKDKKLPRAVKFSMGFLLASVVFWFMAYNAVSTAFSSYASEVWHLDDGEFADCLMIATAAAVVSYIPVGIVSSKIGRKIMILIGVASMAAAFTVGAFASVYASWMIAVFMVVGFGWAAINVNSYPMVVEMALGGDIGKYTGLYYTFSMSAQTLTPIASGFLLEHVSYTTLFPYAAVFMALAFVSMMFVKHGDNKPEKVKKVKAEV